MWKKYDEYFNNLVKSLNSEILQHDSKAKYWHRVNYIIQMLMIANAGIMAFLGACENGPMRFWIQAILAACSAMLISFQNQFNPLEKKSRHLDAASAKNELCIRIKGEMLQEAEFREDPDEFKTWIDDKLSMINQQAPHLFAK